MDTPSRHTALDETTAPEAAAGPGATAPPPDPGATQAFNETRADAGPRADPPSAPAGPHTDKKAPAPQKLTALGDFKLLKKLGQGGMGAVYKGHQVSLDRPCAVKVMAKHLADNPKFIERFYREARLMAKLDHPHIIRSYGVGQEHGFHYLAMEFVEGGSLQDWLGRLGKLSVGDALHVMLACARALEHAHGHGVIHRDIKPDNVLLTRQGVVKLADLGLAKATEEDVGLTQSGVGAGTPLYMAPEQAISAKHADGRSDIYSLGCMLYCMVTGQTPFTGESTLEVLKAKEAGRFTPARKLNPEVPERLDLMIDKMIARKPEQRYQTCTELIRDLESLGKASPALSFFGDDALPSPVATGSAPAARTAAALGKTAAPGARTMAPLGKTAPPETARPKPEDDSWYVSYQAGGQLVTRRLTTEQVKALIVQPHFDLSAQASRKPNEPMRSLASYPEFGPTLRSRLAKAQADRKTSQFKDLYGQIDKEQRRRERWAWLKKYTRSAGDWLGLIFWLAVLAAGCYGGWWAFQHFTR